MSNVHVFDHPLIQHKLSILRDKNTGAKAFRELVSEIAMLMCYEATRDLPLEEVEVETPLAVAKCRHIAGKKLAIVPILRAGLGMVDGMVALMPNVKVGHIGLYRDPNTLEPVKYYFKMPPDIQERDAIIVDPMLATGGSAAAAAMFLKEVGVKHIKLMSIIGAPEGVERMQAEHPDVDIYVAGMDECLNDHGYIVPGLGDAGDRIFRHEVKLCRACRGLLKNRGKAKGPRRGGPFLRAAAVPAGRGEYVHHCSDVRARAAGGLGRPQRGNPRRGFPL